MKKCDILIIDDDNDDVEILSEAFINSGMDCVHYEQTATKAITYLETLDDKDNYPKIIITDFYLSGTTGVELITNIKKIDSFKHIPIVLLSTQRTEKEIQKFIQMGAADYLVKPSSYEDYLKLAAIIKEKIH